MLQESIFVASFEGNLESINGQDILVGNSDVKKNSCRKITVNYDFNTEEGYCKLIYLDSNLEERVLAESGKGEIAMKLPAASYGELNPLFD